jgi:hypothetical protein
LKANDTLYLLVSYFNYNSNKSRERNIYSFIEKNSNSKVKIVVIDVIFNNENWADNILKELQDKDIVHCFKEADFLNQDGTPSNFNFLSKCYIYINNIKLVMLPYIKNYFELKEKEL